VKLGTLEGDAASRAVAAQFGDAFNTATQLSGECHRVRFGFFSWVCIPSGAARVAFL